MEIILDLSPMLINRTAMFDVCREAANAIASVTRQYQYFGKTVDTILEPDGSDHFRDELGEWMAAVKMGGGALENKISKTQCREVRTRKVFLDPLYTIFSDLNHTDLVLILDLSTVTHPWWHDEIIGELYRVAFDRIAGIQPGIMSISNNTADTFCANYGYPRRSIEVVPLYTPSHLRREDRPVARIIPRPYFLFVGSLEARKNVKGAILAFDKSELAYEGYWLLIVGGEASEAGEIKALAAQTANVTLCGFVSNQELASLYAGATGFVYPSYLEGFGVPLLEAMYYGIPSVASLTGASPEVGGDLVAYCDPDDHAAIADQLIRIKDMPEDERALLAQQSKARAMECFSLNAFRKTIARVVAQP